MPTYAYACKDCSHAFDIAQKFSDDSLTVCPKCQGRLRKKFGSVGVSFKGSGFYRTDSRAAASPSTDTAKSPSSEGSPSSSGGSSSSDSSSTPTKTASGAGSSSTGSGGSGSSSASD